MSEGFATTYAKAIDDLAGKIFISGSIASLLVEFGASFQTEYGVGLIATYLAFLIFGGILTGAIFFVIAVSTYYLFEGKDIAPYIAVSIMPLGFAGLFPEHFPNFPVPYSQVTGIAILAWSFMLLNKGAWHKYV